MAKKREPSKTRNLDEQEHIVLVLKAYFAGRTRHECKVVCETAEDVLVLTNDRKARLLLGETMGRAVDTPLTEIPTDDVLAAMLEIPLARVREGRKTGRLDGFVFMGRTAGRWPRARTSAYLDWMVPWPTRTDPLGKWDDPCLTVELSLVDLPEAAGLLLPAMVDRFFARAAGTGACTYAEAEVLPLRFGRGSGSDLIALSDLSERAVDVLWGALRDDRHGYLPGVRPASLLSKRHLAKLGGRGAFLKELRTFSATDPPGCTPMAKPLANGMLLVCPDDGVLEHPEDRYSFGMVESNVGPAWLLVRYAQAGLLIVQAPDAMRALEREWTATRTDLDASRIAREAGAPAAAQEIAARQAAFEEFMARMWQSPPAFIASVAHPVPKAERSAIGRSRGGHGANLTAFRIARTKGLEPVGLWGPISSRGEFWYPYFIGGPSAKTALAVFDPSKHGFDGEHGAGRRILRKTPDAYHCVRCGHDRFHITTMFEYSEPEEITDPEERARAQDFFTWFWLIARCAGCKHRAEVGSAECA